MKIICYNESNVLLCNKTTYSEEKCLLLCQIIHTLKIQAAQHRLQLIHPATHNRIMNNNKSAIKHDRVVTVNILSINKESSKIAIKVC
jgi:hypothetical protein